MNDYLFYLNLIVSRFLGTIVSTRWVLCKLLARSKDLDCSPWLIITFRGLGLTLPTKAISSFRDEWPLNPSMFKNFILIGTVSSFPSTTNFASLIVPSCICRPRLPGDW